MAPIDRSTPRWECPTCHTVYEGDGALCAAEQCENAPTPDALPAGTLAAGSLMDLLDPTKWTRISGHHYEPDRRRTEDDGTEVTVVGFNKGRRRVHGDVTIAHRLRYDGVSCGDHKDRDGTPYKYRDWSSDTYLWPHLPGVLNFGGHSTQGNVASVYEFTAAASLDKGGDYTVGNRRTPVEQTVTERGDDAAVRSVLAALGAPDAPVDFLERWLDDHGDSRLTVSRSTLGRTETWLDKPDRYMGRLPSGFLRPDLDDDTRDLVLKLCQDRTVDNGFRDSKGGTVIRRAFQPIPTEGWQRDNWEPTAAEPHYGLSHTGSRAGSPYWPWLTMILLRDMNGDAPAVAWHLMVMPTAEAFALIEREAQRWLDGDNAAIVPAEVLTPSFGMARGPRAGRMRPEHKTVVAKLGASMDDQPGDVVARYIITPRETLSLLGVTVTDENIAPFGGAPIIAVASGKGGVGKSTTAAALAYEAVRVGSPTLLIDADVTGPTLGTLFDLPEGIVVHADGRYIPTEVTERLCVASAAQIVRPESAITWGEYATRVWLRFIATRSAFRPELVIVDLPPGYGPVHHAVDQEIPPDAWLFVTTGSPLSIADCRRAISAHGYSRDHAGIVENASHLPDGTRLHGNATDVERFAAEVDLEFLGSLPWQSDPQLLAETPVVGRILDMALLKVREAADAS